MLETIINTKRFASDLRPSDKILYVRPKLVEGNEEIKSKYSFLEFLFSARDRRTKSR